LSPLTTRRDYGGSILTRLHTWVVPSASIRVSKLLRGGLNRNHRFPYFCVYTLPWKCVSTARIHENALPWRYLYSGCCLATGTCDSIPNRDNILEKVVYFQPPQNTQFVKSTEQVLIILADLFMLFSLLAYSSTSRMEAMCSLQNIC
jgi:hypothetical protein